MDEKTVIRAIERQNPWYKGSALPAFDKPIIRTAGLKAFQHLTGTSNRSLVMLGPRQVGKTVILLQIVRKLLDSTQPQAICYLRLDDPELAGNSLGAIAQLYRRSFWSPNRLAYLLLDEVHASPDWSQQMKAWVDDNEPNRVLATGSIAPHIARSSRESGPGRWDELFVSPLDFFEYALLRGDAGEEDAKPQPDDWWKKPCSINLYKKNELWQNYLLCGGFPASALDNDTTTSHQRLREDIYERVLVRDMAFHFKLRSFDTLRYLFRYIAEQSSGIANLTTLSSRIGSPLTTINELLLRLRETFLVGQTLPFAKGKVMLRPRPKLYLCDASLRSAVLLHDMELFKNSADMGLSCETAVYCHLHRLARERSGELLYWRDEKGEVDFVLKLPGTPVLPIEVTTGENANRKITNLGRCAEDIGAKYALLLYIGEPETLKTSKSVNVIQWNIPDFLWALSSAERAKVKKGGLT